MSCSEDYNQNSLIETFAKTLTTSTINKTAYINDTLLSVCTNGRVLGSIEERKQIELLKIIP